MPGREVLREAAAATGFRPWRLLEAAVLLVAVGALAAILVVVTTRDDSVEVRPLRVSAANPRYFEDASGRAVYLTGSHTWASLADLGRDDPPPPFDFAAYLDLLSENGHNFVRLWTWEQPQWTLRDGTRIHVSPLPWARAGPGVALDGLPKFDLTRFAPEYFSRLQDRVRAAEARGIYVSVMLFEGWELRFSKPPYDWRTHPLNGANNVQGIDGDVDGDGSGTEVHTLASPRVTDVQRAYVRKVIETVSGFDNVLFEICNECGKASVEWQYAMIELVKREDGERHPVGMTAPAAGSAGPLLESPADWISPGDSGWLEDPPPSDGRKVVLLDTDHLCGVCTDPAFVWKSLFRGYNPIVMDPIDGDNPVRVAPGDVAGYRAIERAQGAAARLAGQLDLGSATPRPDLFSTGYGLVVPGRRYVAYQPGTGPIEVDLGATGSRFDLRWLDPATGRTVAGGSVASGRVALTPPFDGPSIAILDVSE